MRVGILGGGQLARMLALAGYPLGIHTLCFDPVTDACANDVTQVIQGSYADKTQLQNFAEQVDVITFETENIPLATAEFVNQIKPIYPTLEALKIGQDRALEKTFFNDLNIPTAKFAIINSLPDLEDAISQINYPAILKTTRMGYDGKGQFIIKGPNDIIKAWEILGGQTLILEQFIQFERELSLIAVRDKAAQIQFYPLVENTHQQGILYLSKAPFSDKKLQLQAEDYVQTILTKLNYIGTFVIELFQMGEKLFANEMAPRVHNSGHWTIEGADTSQFANHLRAICGLPIGSTAAKGYSAMFNIIGTECEAQKILSIPQTHYHTYEKLAKPKRKLGHVTINTTDSQMLDLYIEKMQILLTHND